MLELLKTRSNKNVWEGRERVENTNRGLDATQQWYLHFMETLLCFLSPAKCKARNPEVVGSCPKRISNGCILVTQPDSGKKGDNGEENKIEWKNHECLECQHFYNRVLFTPFKNYYSQNYFIIASSAKWLWSMVSYIKGGTQAKGIWKQDPEANIWAQEGWEWGVDKASQWWTS